MVLFKSTVLTVLATLFVTSTFMIEILKGEGQTVHLFDKAHFSTQSFVYFLQSLLALALVVPVASLSTLLFDFGIITKAVSCTAYAFFYCLLAPTLYKTATGVKGKKYTPVLFTSTLVTFCVAEIAFSLLNRITENQAWFSVIAAPSICFLFVVSIYLITLYNLQNTKRKHG